MELKQPIEFLCHTAQPTLVFLLSRKTRWRPADNMSFSRRSKNSPPSRHHSADTPVKSRKKEMYCDYLVETNFKVLKKNVTTHDCCLERLVCQNSCSQIIIHNNKQIQLYLTWIKCSQRDDLICSAQPCKLWFITLWDISVGTGVLSDGSWFRMVVDQFVDSVQNRPR